MKKFSLRNTGLAFTLALFVSLFASNATYAQQYVDKTTAVSILVAEVNTSAQNLGNYSGSVYDYEINKMYFMKYAAEFIYDSNLDVADALDKASLVIGYTPPGYQNNTNELSATRSGIGNVTGASSSSFPPLSNGQYADIYQEVSDLLQ